MAGRIWFYGGRREAIAVAGAPAIEIRQLSVAYPDTTEAVLHDIHLTLSAGTNTALVGPNGAGKSTLLKAIASLLPATAGKIQIYGQPVGACHHRVAYLAQRSALDWSFPATVWDVVMSGRYVHLGWLRSPKVEDHRLVRESLVLMGLEDLVSRRINRLSGGQQQRMLVARALAQQAQVLLLDEPLNALDQSSRKFLADVFCRLKSQGKTLLISTHEHDNQECEFDQVVYLFEGRRVPGPADEKKGGHPDA